MGGLSRRATIIEQKKINDPQALVVDAGNFAAASVTVSGRDLAQQRRKAQLQMEAFQLSKTDVIGVGEKDLALGVDWFFSQAKNFELPLVASNLSCEGNDVAKRRELEVNGLTVHFYSLLNPKQVIDGCESIDPKAALAEQNNNGAIVKVLFSQLLNEQLKVLLETQEFDIVIDARNGKQIIIPESLDDTTVLLGTGRKGKYVGYATMTVDPRLEGFRAEGGLNSLENEIQKWERRLERLEIENPTELSKQQKRDRQIQFYQSKLEDSKLKLTMFQAAKASNPIENQMLPLDRKVKDWEGLIEPIAKTKQDIETLAQMDQVEQYNGDFVGSGVCGGCHVLEKKQWMTTPHSHAWRTLEETSREMDLECYSCHATGVFHPKGPKHPKQLGTLINVGCESCHGPGKEHIAAPSTTNIKGTLTVEVCVDCHDGIKDEGRFDVSTYWPRIVHESSGD